MFYYLFKSSSQLFYPVIAQKTRKVKHKKEKKALSWLRGHIRCLHGTWSRIRFLQLCVFIWQFCFRITYKKNVFQQRSWTEMLEHTESPCVWQQTNLTRLGVCGHWEWNDWIISGVSNRHCRVEDEIVELFHGLLWRYNLYQKSCIQGRKRLCVLSAGSNKCVHSPFRAAGHVKTMMQPWRIVAVSAADVPTSRSWTTSGWCGKYQVTATLFQDVSKRDRKQKKSRRGKEPKGMEKGMVLFYCPRRRGGADPTWFLRTHATMCACARLTDMDCASPAYANLD